MDNNQSKTVDNLPSVNHELDSHYISRDASGTSLENYSPELGNKNKKEMNIAGFIKINDEQVKKVIAKRKKMIKKISVKFKNLG